MPAKLALIATLVLFACAACEKTEEAKEKASAAAKEAGEAAESVKEGASSAKEALSEAAASDTAKSLKEGAGEAFEKGKELAAEAMESDAAAATGELAGDTLDRLKSRAGDVDGDSIEDIIVKGKQVTDVTREVHSTVNQSVESDSRVEPIYQEIGEDEDSRKKTDDAIGEMPHTEVIDGVTVGFKDLVETSNEKRVDERGFVVVWRREGKLVGFVYHTKREVDVETLAKEAPRLVGLIHGVVSK